MTSSINPNNIDGTYPIAGQDNDSQGFRDNFTNIKNNLTFAKTELEDLQSKVLVTSKLDAGGSIESQNNLNNTPLIGAQLKKTTLTVFEQINTDGTVDVSWADGSYQTLGPTTGSVNLTFSGWPTGASVLASVILEANIASTAHTITLPSEVALGNASIQGIDATGTIISFDTVGTYQFEFSTWDNGDTVTIRDLSRNNKQVNQLDVGNAIVYSGYQWANSNAAYGNLVTGNTFTVGSHVSRVILEPSAGFSSLFIKLPANVNAKTVRISSTANITNVNVSGVTGTVVAPTGNITLTAGQGVEYQFISATGTWYKS